MVGSIETRADAATRRSKGARDGQQLKALRDEQLGQVVEQFADARPFGQAHLGGDLPTGSGAHIGGMGVEQQFLNVGTGVDLSIRELAEAVARATGYSGTIQWDTSKPDGTPKKQLAEGLRSTVAQFREQLSQRLVRL